MNTEIKSLLCSSCHIHVFFLSMFSSTIKAVLASSIDKKWQSKPEDEMDPNPLGSILNQMEICFP